MQVDVVVGKGRAGRPPGLAVAILAAAVALLMAGCSPKTDTAAQPAGDDTAREVTLTADQRQHIQLYTATPSTFRKTVEATGVVDFDNDHATSVLAPFSGPVSQLPVSLGQKVRAGDALATVASPDFATAVSTYNKALVAAQNTRKLADADKDLAQHNGVSMRENEQAQTDAASAEADLAAAVQGVVSLNVDPQTVKDVQAHRSISRIGGVIRSPIAGTVVEKLITPGQLLQAGTTACFTVADLSHVWVMAQISASDLASVSLGDRAEVETGAGAGGFSGAVTNISALVNPDTRSVVARVAVANPGGLLKKQMYVRVLIQGRRERTGILVPVAAVLHDDENMPFVYVAQPGGRFARQHVTLGDRTGDRYEIASGLQAGAQVVSDGGIFVQFMQSQ